MKIKMSLITKMVIMIISASLLSAVTSVYISYRTYSNTIDKYYKETITNVAETAASMMDSEIIGDYADKREMDDEYEGMLSILKKITNQNDIEYLYIEVIRGDKAIAIMDADEENPMDFREEFDVSEGADTSKLEDGIPAFISNEEGVGWMCSVFQPIKDSDGNTVALVGADLSMNQVMGERHQFLNIVLIVILIAAFISTISMVLYTRNMVTRPIKRLAEATRNFISDKQKNEEKQKESPIEKLQILSNDEIGELTNSVKIMEKEIHTYIDNLTTITAEKERISAELNVATQIQADMLPSIFPPFPEYTEFDLYATMNPAKEVGGDFYDFFMADEDHLVMVMADVSGKGVPAALFMVITKTLLKNCAQNNSSPKTILETVNNQLCENNEADMFVTVWLGILEISTGKLVAANAGHEYPVVKRAGKDFELIKDKHGFVLAGMEDFVYSEYELNIEEGDMLFLYTDGIPEATNSENVQFGNERMLESLNSHKDCDVKELLVEVKKDIESFVGDAPQFDDITMLGMIYEG